MFEEIATDSLDLLKKAVAARTNLPYRGSKSIGGVAGGERPQLINGQQVLEACQEVFTVEFYANIMGMFELNNIGAD